MANEQQQGGGPSSKRWPMAVMPDNRDLTTAKDSKLINCFVESGLQKGDYHVYRRAGTLVQSQPSGGAANGYGVYNWKGDVYSIFGATIYKNGTSIGSVDTTNGVYAFNQSLGTPTRMIIGNGVKGYTYDGTTFATISGTNWPTSFVKGFSYLDQTTYVMTAAAAIQGCDIGNSGSWTNALNVITAQIEPDGGVALSKQLVYVVALKQWSTEVFYDAANATGSPLSTVQGAKVAYGCLDANSVQSIDDDLIWLSTTRSAVPQVVMLSGLKCEPVSTKAIDRLLLGANFTTVYSFSFKDRGHKFYVLTLKSSNLTLVYDLTEKMWSQWADGNGNYLPIVASTYDANNKIIWQHESNGKLYYASSSYNTDDGSLIGVDIYTPNWDGGSPKIKALNRMFFKCDQAKGSILQVRKSDDDYQTWSNFRSVDLSVRRPYLDRCGSFYKRSLHLRHRCNTPFRIASVDLEVDLGVL